MNSSSPEFVPENELERAFAQASCWSADRVWRRAAASHSAGQWGLGSAFLMRLANTYVFADDAGRLLEVMISICDHMHLLEPAQKKSLCRISLSFVEMLFDADKGMQDARVAIILTAMIRLTAGMKNRDLAYVDMLGYLRRIYGVNLKPEDFDMTLLSLSQALPDYLDRTIPDSGVPERPKGATVLGRQSKWHAVIISKPRQKFLSIIRRERFTDPARFVGLLLAFSLERFQQYGISDDFREMDELLDFYHECEKRSAQPVGEMLWLAMETELREVPNFVSRLAVVSLEKASDVYLLHRFLVHLQRLSFLSPGLLRGEELAKSACESLVLFQSETSEEDQNLVTDENKKPNEGMDLPQIDAQIVDRNWTAASELTRQMLELANVSPEDKFRLSIRSARIRIGESDTYRCAFILDKLFSDLQMRT